jgi:hypothetical protein
VDDARPIGVVCHARYHLGRDGRLRPHHITIQIDYPDPDMDPSTKEVIDLVWERDPFASRGGAHVMQHLGNGPADDAAAPICLPHVLAAVDSVATSEWEI